MIDIYKYITFNKTRFTTSKGALSAEQLTDLSVPFLQGLVEELDKEVAELTGSRFSTNNTARDGLNIKIEVLLDIIETKEESADTAANAQANAVKKQKLLQMAAEMDDKELTDGKSAKQLRKEAGKL